MLISLKKYCMMQSIVPSTHLLKDVILYNDDVSTMAHMLDWVLSLGPYMMDMILGLKYVVNKVLGMCKGSSTYNMLEQRKYLHGLQNSPKNGYSSLV